MGVTFFSLSQDWQKELNEARSLYKSKRYAESLKKYKSAQKHAPKDVDLSDEVAQASYKAEDYENAQKKYNQSSSKKGSSGQKAKTYHNIGNAYMKQKKYGEAIEAYKEALRNNPNDEETRYNLSEAMKRKKQQDQQKKEQEKQNQQKQQQNQNQNQNKNQQNQNQNNNKQQNKNNADNSEQKKSSLNSQKTERMLDELTKKEIETKKKINGNKGKTGRNSSGKDW